MNDAIRISKEKAAKAVQEYRNELLKEFLLKAVSLSEKLSALIQKGVDDERNVCLEDAEVDMDRYYTVLNRNKVSNLKAVLDSMDANNAIKAFEEFEHQHRGGWMVDMYDYQDFAEMEDLESEYVSIGALANSL